MIKLVKIKETAEEGTVSKIRELLIPFEYTRGDKIIDIAFTAVTEIGEALEEEDGRLRNEDAEVYSTALRTAEFPRPHP